MIRNRTGPSAHSLWCSRSHLQECLCIWSYRWWNWWWYKIMVKFAAERGGWKKQRLERYTRWEILLLLAAKIYVISVSGWLASWGLVCCDFQGHQKCDDSNFALIWTLPLSVIVLRMVWFSFLEYWVTEILLWCSLCPGYWDRWDYWNISAWTALVYRLLWNLGFI